MSGKIKALISILAGIVVIVAAVFIIIAISGSSNDITIYDFRVLNKNGDAVSLELDKKTVYLTNSHNNYFEFAVYLESSDPNVIVTFESSDESVAKAFVENGQYICRYYKAGNATISAYVGEERLIQDKFDVVVKENIVNGLVFAENEFIDQSGEEVSINIFSDSKQYVFPFEAIGFNNGPVNYDSIQLENNPDSLITKIELDVVNRLLKIRVDRSYDNPIASFTEKVGFKVLYSSSGDGIIANNISVNVNVKANVNIGYIAIVSNNPYFENERYVYPGVMSNGEVFEIENDEVQINKIYLNSTHNYFYVKFYQITANKDRTLLSVENVFLNQDMNLAGIEKNTKENYIKVTVKADIGNHEFFQNFGFMDIDYVGDGIPDYSEIYSENNGVYTFNYWDERFERTDVVCDEYGNIKGFYNED